MKYPKKIKKNGTIGVCAPSSGFIDQKNLIMCENAKERLENEGYKVKYSKSCFKDFHGRSAPKKQRAKEFLDMYLDKDIDIIISLGGGEYEMEILDELNLKQIKNPKLFCGCSDNSILTFLLTTYCDICTVYGHNFYELGINHFVIDDYIASLSGKETVQKEIKMVQERDDSWKMLEPQTTYNCNYHNDWKVYPKKNIAVTGMMIGGLLDDLICICGTKYDKVKEFTKKYQENGFIWYLDICTLTPEEVKRALWQLKNADWFKYCKLIMIGRPINMEDSFGVDYRDNMYQELEGLKVPIVFDVNYGHIPPSYHVYNGGIAEVVIDNKEAYVKYIEN